MLGEILTIDFVDSSNCLAKRDRYNYDNKKKIIQEKMDLKNPKQKILKWIIWCNHKEGRG